VQRQRPVNPTIENILNFGIPHRFTLTTDGDPRLFLQARQNAINPANGSNSSFLAFGTAERIRNLLDSSSIFMDGTFKVTPSPYYQLFTINFMKRCAISEVDKLFTGLTFLLTHKTEFMYHTIFAWIQEFSFQHWPQQPIQWQTAMMDFETGLRPALHHSMPNLHVVGCFFHFCQCIFRQVKTIGLQAAYNNNPYSTLRNWLKKVMALAFLPLNLVRDTYEALGNDMFFIVQGDNVDQLPALDTLVEYIEVNWMGEASIPLWNVNFPNMENLDDAGMHRTNNDLEGYHLRLLLKFGKKPNFWKFIEQLQSEQLSQDQMFNNIDQGIRIRPRGVASYRNNDEERIRHSRNDLLNQTITPLVFLQRVSIAIAPNHIN